MDKKVITDPPIFVVVIFKLTIVFVLDTKYEGLKLKKSVAINPIRQFFKIQRPRHNEKYKEIKKRKEKLGFEMKNLKRLTALLQNT